MSSEAVVDSKAAAAVEAKPAEALADDVAVDAVYLCLDVSGSIRGDVMYPEWVANDIKSLPDLPADARWILWGSASLKRDSLQEVLDYLAGSECLGGTDPFRFVQLLPTSGVIDLHVYTDGEIGEGAVAEARAMLDGAAGSHKDLKIRRVVISYVNKQLDQMNVGLSAIFDGHVLQMHSTRVADGTKLLQFDAAPLDSSVGAADILDQYLVLGKSEEEMTKGMHYLGQMFANASPARRRDIRRLVKERVDAVNAEHRARTLSADEEKALLQAVERRDWKTARKPFVGNVVKDEVKLLQGQIQRFLNQSREGGLIRVSAYAPLVLQSSKGGQQFDVMEEVLLDHIMFLGMGKEAVVVMPVEIDMPERVRARPTVRGNGRAARVERHAVRARMLNTATKCALAATVRANFDNTFGLDTLFSLREQQLQYAVGNDDDDAHWGDEDAAAPFEADNFVAGLEAGEHLQNGAPAAPAAQVHYALDSSYHCFGKNPFTRQDMECVLLVPVSAESLAAERLAQVDAWNAHMLSRFIRGGRSMPSVPLVLALVLEKAFAQWKLEDIPRAEDRAEAERLRDVWRRYVARMPSPLTFTVGMPVVVTGSFAAAARMACAVLQAALDPSLPLDVLTQFWSTQSEEDAARVWDTLRVYAGLGDAPFPGDHHRTLCALVAGVQYAKSGRDAKLRAKKGRSYSVRAYTKRLDQLAKGRCHPERLAHEEKLVRKDLTGAAMEEPLLCVHGVEADKCVPLEGQQHDTLCVETCRPTLLNKATLDMWYVGLPADRDALALDSLHKAMWQLARKRTKGKHPRFSSFPPPEAEFTDYVNHRVRAAFLNRDGDAARVLPTVSCARLAQDIALTYSSYAELLSRKPSLNRLKFMKALRAPRAVCEFNECCRYIREAAPTEQQRAWIDEHATHALVGDDQNVLSGKRSYRNL